MVVGLVVAVAPLAVKGDAACPLPSEVEAHFVKNKTSQTLGQGHRASIAVNADGVTLRLEDAQGVAIGEKSLPHGSCEGLAAAAAATLVVWETNLPPRKTTFVAVPSRKPLPASEGANADAEATQLAWRFDIAVSGALSGLIPRPGLFAAVAAGPRESTWRIFAHAGGTLAFEDHVGQGTVRWSRPGFGLGASLRVNDAAARVDVSASLDATWLKVSGQGYEQDFNATAFDPGTTVSLRVSGAVASYAGWFTELSTSVYPLQKTAFIEGTGQRLAIPPFGLVLRAGVFWGER